MNEKLILFTDNQKEFLKYLKSRYKLFHQSNIFFRDVHYGVMAFLEINKIKYTYPEAEELTRKLIVTLEQSNVLKKINDRTWVLNYPEFALPRTKKAA